MLKKLLIILVVLVVLALGFFFFILPGLAEGRMNRVLVNQPRRVSARAVELHRTLLIADLHADSLLWNRDLLERGTRGHVDIPRLIEGNVALEGFTIVTKTPRGINIERNDDKSDNITLLALAQRWPMRTWGSLLQRALYQSERLHDYAARSGGKLVLIKSAADLRSYVERRRRDASITAGFLGVEGAHALEGNLDNIDVLFNAGIRMMAPTHTFDTDLGGAASGIERGGLTEKGREMVRRMEAKRMLVDIAHASPATIADILSMATRPVLVSHTGVRGTCDNNRNLGDEQLRGVARTGGLVGIGFWPTVTCSEDPAAIARAMRYTANLIGVQYIALGSDFDGAVAEPFDASRLVELTDALLAEGFTDDEIRMIMGENVVRVLSASLP